MLFFLLACATPPQRVPSAGMNSSNHADGLTVQLVVDGDLPSRIAHSDEADLVLFYGGEERGSLEPCGCPNRPRGGLARMSSYIHASQTANADKHHLLLNGGYWLEDAVSLDGTPRADVPVMNHWMVSGMQQAGFSALNIAYNDIGGLSSLGEAVDLPMISANISGPGISQWEIISWDDMQVGIMGISTPGFSFIETPGFDVIPPIRAGKAVLNTLAPQVDLVIVLAYNATEAARELARTGKVDVIIDTNQYREVYEPFREGNAIWVRSHYQTMRLGELRIGLDDEKNITWALDRRIDLDPSIPNRKDEEVLIRTARREIDAIQREIYGRR